MTEYFDNYMHICFSGEQDNYVFYLGPNLCFFPGELTFDDCVCILEQQYAEEMGLV